MDLKDLIADDAYENMQASLLHSGRGRPKMLRTDIPTKNRLLVQLLFLREEADWPLDAINDWIFQAAPALASVAGSRTRFVNLAQAARARFERLPCEDRISSLDGDIYLDYSTSSLSEIGITRSSIQNCPTSVPECLTLRNEVVVDLDKFCAQQTLPKKLVFQWISVLTGFEITKLPRAIEAVKKSYIKLLKNSHRDRDSLNRFLNGSFFLPSSKKENSTTPAQHQTNACSKRPKNTPSKVILRVPCLDCNEKTSELKDVMEAMRSVQKDKAEKESEVLKLKDDKEKLEELSKIQKDRLESKHQKQIDRCCDQIKACKVQSEMLKKECREVTNELMSQAEYIYANLKVKSWNVNQR